MIKSITLVFCQFICFCGYAQTLSGNFSQLTKQEIKLEGFNGLKTYPIDSVFLDEQGNFKLHYAKSDIGVGYLIAADNKPLFVILSGEDVEIQGETLINTETIKVVKGQENKWFEQYAKEHPKREQALSAWVYLENIYQQDSLFAKQKALALAIKEEKKRINEEDAQFLASLPNRSYVSWYLPTRKLISSVSVVAQYRTQEIPATLAAFRNLDYTDPRLYKSGLFKDAIDNYFWLLENSGKSLDSVFVEMKISIDAMMKYLIKDNKKLNEVTDYLFDLLERQSLFQASAYLAIKVLNEESCTIDSNLAKQLETYRAMKKGNIAPDMDFEKAFFTKPTQSIGNLSDLKSPYTLVVFGASWCPKCNEELPEIFAFYNNWKAKGVEVVFISLEDDRKSFMDFAEKFPFLSYSDLKKWDSKIATDYYVFATPTLFLLNNKREILLRPNSAKQVDAWIKTYLVAQEK